MAVRVRSATVDEWPSAPGNPLLGTPYCAGRLLGAGATGEVFEAEHEALGYRVVVKVLRADLFQRFDVKNRMRLEAHACMRVRHGNLVRVIDAGETDDGRTFLVMERLEGRTLRDELRERRFLPVAEAVSFAREALAGVSVAHAAGLIHRDLKPENLFLATTSGGERVLKVLDFGLAKITAAGREILGPTPHVTTTAEGIMVGTPRYFSPEQANPQGTIDDRADVYSMGWVLHEMLTGQAPFPDRSTLAALTRAHLRETPPLPSAIARQPVPAALDRAVMRALTKRPEDRFQTAEAFRAELSSVQFEGS